MNYALEPNLRSTELLIPLLAQVFCPLEKKWDFEVATLKLKKARAELTELLSKKSELAENRRILQEKLLKLRASLGTARAEKTIFEETTQPPKPKKFFFFKFRTQQQVEYAKKLKQLEDAVLIARHRLSEAEAEDKKNLEALNKTKKLHSEKEAEVEELKNEAVKAGILSMLTFAVNGDGEGLSRAYSETRGIGRGDKRIYVVYLLLNAVLKNPHFALQSFREVRDLFLPETSAEFRLVRNFLDFLAGREIPESELGLFLKSHFTYEENFRLYRFLQVANSFLPEEVENEEDDYFLFLKLLFHWVSKKKISDDKLNALRAEPEKNPLLLELVLFTLISYERYEQALVAIGVDAAEFARQTNVGTISEKQNLLLMKLANLKHTLPIPLRPTMERVFAFTLICLKKVATEGVFRQAWEILRPEISNTLRSYLQFRTAEHPKPLVKRHEPTSLYQLP